MRVVCDIETNGLELKDITKMHCIVAKDVETNNLYVFDTDDKINQFPAFAKGVEEWIGHNFLSYDAPVINHWFKEDIIDWKKVTDTIVLSRLFNPAASKVSKAGKKYKGLKRMEHGLEAWGQLLGYPKMDFHAFEERTQEMVEYCINDVEVNHKVYTYLMKEGKDFSDLSIRLEHDNTYMLYQQKKHGFQIDVAQASQLLDRMNVEINELERAMDSAACTIYEKDRIKKIRRNKEGEVYTVDKRILMHSKFKKIDKDTVLLYKAIEFNPRSPSVVAKHLDKIGWKPVEFTPNGAPKTTSEINLATIPDTAPAVYHKFKHYRTLTARRDNVKSWFENMCEEGKVHGTVFSVGAKTHRCAHRDPNTANIAGKHSLYGAECRMCWTVEDTDKQCLLGTDASGVQLRMLAHYLNDPNYTAGVLGDPHTTHQHILELPERSIAKTWIYAWIFGAGNARLGDILGGTAKDGADAIRLFEERVPALKRFKAEGEAAAQKGYMVGLDGRHIPVMDKRGYIPACLQGGEQALMKLAKKLWYFEAKKRGWSFEIVGDIHDEWQTECDRKLILDKKIILCKDEDNIEMPMDNKIWSQPKKLEEGKYQIEYNVLGELQVKALRKAGEILKLNCPMDGEYNIGTNWLETH